MTDSRQARAFLAFQERWNAKASRKCLFGTCAARVIRSHSVQNRIVLDGLVEHNHVYSFLPAINGAELVKLGRNQATTFGGFCSQHDNDLFLPIDFKSPGDFNPSDPVSAACFAMRALAREYCLKLTALEVHQEIISLARSNQLVDLQRLYDMTDEEVATTVATFEHILVPYTEGAQLILGRLERSFRSLLAAIRQRKFHLWQFHVRPLRCRPTVAAAAAFYPEYDFRGTLLATRRRHEDTPILVLNVMPLGGATWVMFAFHRRFANRLLGLLGDFKSRTDQELRVLISKMLVIYCENTVLSPRFVENLSKGDRSKVVAAFTSTTHWAKPYEDMPGFDFFSAHPDVGV